MPIPSEEEDKLTQPDEEGLALDAGLLESAATGTETEQQDDLGEFVAAEDLVSVNIDGVEYKVHKDAAAAMQGRQDDLARELVNRDAVISELRTPAQAPAAEPSTTRDYSTELFEDPNKVVANIKEDISGEIINKVRAEYAADQQQRTFWSDFYTSNKDLAQDDILVKAVLQHNWNKLESLPTEQASSKLADLTRQEVLRMTRDRTQSNKSGDRSASLEGASNGSSAPVKKKEDDDKVVSLSSIIKDRKKQRIAKAKA